MKNEGEVLDSPIWIMLINIVALEMLGAKMPKPTGLYWYLDPDYYSSNQRPVLWLLTNEKTVFGSHLLFTQTDVELLVVVATAAAVTQPLAIKEY